MEKIEKKEINVKYAICLKKLKKNYFVPMLLSLTPISDSPQNAIFISELLYPILTLIQ